MPDGSITSTRSEYLDIHRKLFAANNWALEFDIVSVDATSDDAIITTKSRYKESANGSIDEKENLVTFIFRLEAGEWKLVHDQNTRLAFHSHGTE